MKCLRLSYHQRVTEIVPDTFACFIPEKPGPQFRFALEGPGHSASTAMIASIKAKCSPEELLEQMREVEGVGGDETVVRGKPDIRVIS